MTRSHEVLDANDINEATKPAMKREPNGSADRKSPTLAAQVVSVPERDAGREAAKTAEFRQRLAEQGLSIEAAKRNEAKRQQVEAERKRKELSAEVKAVARLSRDDYELERRKIAKKFEIRLDYLDECVGRARGDKMAGGWTPPETEPWPETVDGVALLDELAAAIKRHVGVPTRGEDAIALWNLHAHCIDAADITPRLSITSPTPECGKTTLLQLVGDLVPRKLAASNITPAATFRAIEKFQPTLLIDEADTFLRDNNELRGVLNSGHSRANAFVVRTEGDNHEPVPFSTWCPVAIAMIGQLPATLASRSIHIELQRLTKGEYVEPYHHRKHPYGDLARKCARWAKDNTDALCDAEPDMEGMVNRRADNWRALFAIADRAGGQWPNRAREAALTLRETDAGQTTAVALIEDIRAIIGSADRIASETLAESLAQMVGRPWPEFGKAKKPITQNAIARLLKGFKVQPVDIRHPDTGRPCKGYWTSALQSVFERYL
jgi:putative DNA primase/helicase